MTKQRVNLDIDKTLWKKVGIRSAELEITKRDFVEKAIVELLENTKEEVE